MPPKDQMQEAYERDAARMERLRVAYWGLRGLHKGDLTPKEFEDMAAEVRVRLSNARADLVRRWN